MKKVIILMIFLLSSLYAEIKIVPVEVSAYGSTRDAAVENGLIRALQQVNGVSISSARAIVRRSTKGKILVNDTKNVVKVSTKSQIAATATKTSGSILNYEVLSLKQVSDGGYNAKLLVRVGKYKSPGLNPRKRRALAVLPFEYKRSYTIDGIEIDGRSLSLRLTQSIVNQITQTRKFTVLDRQNSKYYQLEKAFLRSGNTDPVELARLGKRLGTDYFIIGQILDFGTQKHTKTNYYSGASKTKSKGYATVAYRILNVPTQQIKWSDTIDIEFNLPNTKRAESIIVKAGDKLAQVLTEQIMFNIYPPRIIKVNGKEGVVNMGGKMLHRGERLEVFAVGKKLYDPYTKESLGREETRIGEVEVTLVKPKISYVKLLSGKLRKGAVLRKPVETVSSKQSFSNEGKDSMFDAMFPR